MLAYVVLGHVVINVCCDPRLVVVPSPVIGCPKAGRCTLDDPSASDDHPMTGHHTAQTSSRRPSALTNQIWFPPEDLTAAKNCLWKRTFRNLNNVMRKYDFVIIADYFCTKTFRYENQSWVKWLKTFLESAEDSMALQLISINEYFRGILSNHCCSGHSCKSLSV